MWMPTKPHGLFSSGSKLDSSLPFTYEKKSGAHLWGLKTISQQLTKKKKKKSHPF